jgi:NAD(P)H-flavin reductase
MGDTFKRARTSVIDDARSVRPLTVTSMYQEHLTNSTDQTASHMSNVMARSYARMFKAARKRLIMMESENFRTTGTIH